MEVNDRSSEVMVEDRVGPRGVDKHGGAALAEGEGGGGGGKEEEEGKEKKRTIVRIIKRRRLHSDTTPHCHHHTPFSPDGIYCSPLDYSLVVFFGGLIVVTFVSVLTRLYTISQPEHIA